VPLPLAIVEELLARDLVVLDRVDADFFEGDAFAGGFGGDFEGEVDGELVGTVVVASPPKAPPGTVYRFSLLNRVIIYLTTPDPCRKIPA
jgi:hypothetical protein